MTEVGVGEGAGSPRERETPGEWATFWVYRSMEVLGKALPTKLGRRVFMALGSAGYHALPKVRATVAANQARVLGRPVDDPQVRANTKEAFRLYGRHRFDTFDLIDWTEEQVRHAFTWEHLEAFQDPLAAGTGVIGVLPHFGNWDAAGRAAAAVGMRPFAVAERLRPDRLYRLFQQNRIAMQMDVVPLDDPRVGSTLAKALADNRLVALVADRELKGGGIEVEMFGASRKMPTGPAMLSITSGAPIVVAKVRQTPDGWTCTLIPVPEVPRTGDRRADVRALTQAIAHEFELVISSYPPEWHLFQPGWE